MPRDSITIGRYSKFQGEFQARPPAKLRIGDCTFVRPRTRIVADLTIGDYGRVHNDILFVGSLDCKIGHNFICCQNSVINSDSHVRIHNNVCIGWSSFIWTHAAQGEQLLGCTLNSFSDVTIEDDVWLMGNDVTIYPGVRLARGTIVFPNSVVTKDTKEFRAYAGSPAVDITHKVKPYRRVAPQDKTRMIETFLDDFMKSLKAKKRGNEWRSSLGDVTLDPPKFYVTQRGGPTSEFDYETRTYTKNLTQIERKLMFYLYRFRARFVPS